MEPEVHIIEKYFQTILNCSTMTNIRLKGGKEIDLLAIDPKRGVKYHVEARVSTSRSFALREKDTYTSKGRAHKRGLDYFAEEKFYHPTVKAKIGELFGDSQYRKILVTWQTPHTNLARLADEKFDIKVVSLSFFINELIHRRATVGSRDVVLRTLELISLIEERKRSYPKELR